MASSLTSTLHRLALAFGVVAGLGLVAPEIALAERPSAGLCKKSKAKKKKKAKRARRRAAAKKATFNARAAKRMQKRGMTDAQIVAKAEAAGYVMNAKQERQMKKLRVRKSLIAALSGAPMDDAPKAAAPIPAAKPIDLNHTIDPNEIDFDSVAPPDGAPKVVAKKVEPEKKGLDTSLRPSAPFVAKKTDSTEKKAPRKIFTAAN